MRSGRLRAAIGAGLLGLALMAGSGAQARTCTVDLDELKQIRKNALRLLKNKVKIDHDKAAAATKQIGKALEGDKVDIDLGDLKGIVSVKGKPESEIQDLLNRVQAIVEACERG